MNTNEPMNQHNCDMDRLMDRFFSHQATDEEIRTLEKWVIASDENRGIFLGRRAAAQVIDAPVTPDDIDTKKALRRIAVLTGMPARTERNHLVTRILSVAAAMLLILSMTLGIQLHHSMTGHRNIASTEITVSAPFGSIVQTTLPDGSTAWLNANSVVKYPAEFANESRPVSLKGEAFFKVNTDKDHPFTVNAGGTSVTATGTEFNVNAYKGLAVTLVEGKVDVSINASGKHIDLSPGDHLSIKDGSMTLTYNCDVRKWCGWREGMLIFDDDPLASVLERLGQIHNITFALKNESIGQSRCHATFTGENISDILHLLELSAPIKFVCTSTDNDSTTSYNVVSVR